MINGDKLCFLVKRGSYIDLIDVEFEGRVSSEFLAVVTYNKIKFRSRLLQLLTL